MTFTFGHVLVTGGAGFIGSQLLLRLIPVSKSITVIDDCTTGNRDSIPKADNVHFIESSYVDEQLLQTVLPDVEHIFHLACRNMVMSAMHMDDDFNVNLYGGYLLLKKANEQCRRLKRLVYTSTASVYGNAAIIPTPESEYSTTLPYAASKLSMEHYCQVFHTMHQLPVTTLRLSNVYGPGQLTSNPYCGVIAKFFEAAEAGDEMPIFGDGTQTRDFTYIDNAIDAILAAAVHEQTNGGVYNVGTGQETSVNTLANLIQQIVGHPNTRQKHVAKRLVDVVYRRCLSPERLNQTIGWKPSISIEEGLRLTYDWKKEGGGH